jgi:hypothetical protein
MPARARDVAADPRSPASAAGAPGRPSRRALFAAACEDGARHALPGQRSQARARAPREATPRPVPVTCDGPACVARVAVAGGGTASALAVCTEMVAIRIRSARVDRRSSSAGRRQPAPRPDSAIAAPTAPTGSPALGHRPSRSDHAPWPHGGRRETARAPLSVLAHCDSATRRKGRLVVAAGFRPKQERQAMLPGRPIPTAPDHRVRRIFSIALPRARSSTSLSR